MAKVEGSNPFIRSWRNPRFTGGFVFPAPLAWTAQLPWVPAMGIKRRAMRHSKNHESGAPLSSLGTPTTLSMLVLPQSNDAYNRRDLDTWASLLSPDVVLRPVPSSPDARECRGARRGSSFP